MKTLRQLLLLGCLLYLAVPSFTQDTTLTAIRADTLFTKFQAVNKSLALALVQDRITLEGELIRVVGGQPSICHMDSAKLEKIRGGLLYKELRCEIRDNRSTLFGKYNSLSDLKDSDYYQLAYADIYQDDQVVKAIAAAGIDPSILLNYLHSSARCDRWRDSKLCRSETDLYFYRQLHDGTGDEYTISTRDENALIVVWEHGTHRPRQYFIVQGMPEPLQLGGSGMVRQTSNKGVYIRNGKTLYFGKDFPRLPVDERHIGYGFSSKTFYPEMQNKFGLAEAGSRDEVLDILFGLLFAGGR